MPLWATILIWLFIIIPLIGVVIALVVAPILERRHYSDLEEREAAVEGMTVHDLSSAVVATGPVRPLMVTGSVVMGVDWWKGFMLMLVNLFGGGVPSVDRVMTRARREAILRMTEQARAHGAVEVVNTRLETSTISKRQGDSGMGSGEILAHGTALIPR